jgi:hypothetical protein
MTGAALASPMDRPISRPDRVRRILRICAAEDVLRVHARLQITRTRACFARIHTPMSTCGYARAVALIDPAPSTVAEVWLFSSVPSRPEVILQRGPETP